MTVMGICDYTSCFIQFKVKIICQLHNLGGLSRKFINLSEIQSDVQLHIILDLSN